MSRDLRKQSEQKEDEKFDIFAVGQTGLPGDDEYLHDADYALGAPNLVRDIPSLDEPVFRGLATTQPASDVMPHMLAMPSLNQPSSQMKGLDLGSDPFADMDGMFSNNQPLDGGFSKHAPHVHNTKTDFGLDYGMANMSLNSELLPPLAMGGYLEPYYHFYCSVAPTMILEHLQLAFRSLHDNPEQHGELDFEVKPSKYKIKCEVYASNGAKIPFVVRIFRLEEQNNRFAVEFQRRRGDPMAFCAIYRDVYNKLSTIIERNDTENMHPLNDAPLDAINMPASDLDANMGMQTISCLTQMIQSDCIDVQSEALRALVPLTTSPEMAKAVCETDCFNMLLERAASDHEDVHRACLTAIANVLEQCPERCPQIVDVVNHRMLLQRACSQTRHVVRETTRVLLAVCEQVTHFEGQSALMHSLQRAMEAHSDHRVRSSWDQILLHWSS